MFARQMFPELRTGLRQGEGGKGVWRCVCVCGLYTYRSIVTTRINSALGWAAMRAILMFHNCDGQSHKTVSTDHNIWRERRAEADSNRGPSAYQPNALPLGQTGTQSQLALISISEWESYARSTIV